TYAVMLVGTLSITGVGVPGLDLGFSGFYSKDSLIDAAWAMRASGWALFAFIVGVIAAGLTSFYSWRLVFMTFHGHAKWGHESDHGAGNALADAARIDHPDESLDGHAQSEAHGKRRPHESGWVMLIPLILLAIGAAFAGGAFAESFIGAGRFAFWKGAIFHLHPLATETTLPVWVAWSPLVVTAVGFVTAWWAYVPAAGVGERIAARRGPLWLFLYNKWYFDELYDVLVVRPARFLGDLCWKGGDKAIIDGFGPDGVAAVSYVVGRATGRAQTGYLYHYAFVMLLGIAGLLSYALWAFTR
ncbi:MAG: NADH-quinone oxidoreductase subunit L, partial [Candidatus Dormibacteria bacterium]